MSCIQMYDNAVKVIKEAILRSQYRAVSHVNKEQLSLYYGIGRYVSENSRVGVWGKSAIKTISQQLQKELPGLRGFSPSNIKNMRQFYEEWYPIINRQPAAGDLKTQAVAGDIKIDESRKPWVPSTCAGDLRGLLMVALRSQGNWRWEGPLGTQLKELNTHMHI